jgi:hypothetical protein
VKSDPLQPSERHDIPSGRSTVQASSFQTTRTFHPDLPLCREASNCSSLHPSRHFSNTSERYSVFDQLWDFFPKHRYGKTAATDRTMWIPVLTCSSIWQVAHSKIRRSDDSLHGPYVRASYSYSPSIFIFIFIFIFKNCMHQIHRPDDRCDGPDVPSLDMEIACS